MNIALVLPYMEPGGVETVVLRLGRYFTRHGHAVSVVTTDREGEWWGLIEESGLRPVCLARADCHDETHQGEQ